MKHVFITLFFLAGWPIASPTLYSQPTSLMRQMEKAIRNGDTTAIARLLNEGVNIDAPLDTFGNAALHLSIKLHQPAAVEFLLGHGPNLELGNNYQVTPLGVAAYYCNTSAAKALIRRGVNIEGFTPLHALIFGFDQQSYNIYQEESEQNQRHIRIDSLKYRFEQSLRHLISAGAGLSVADNSGKTALDYALESNSEDFAAYINETAAMLQQNNSDSLQLIIMERLGQQGSALHRAFAKAHEKRRERLAPKITGPERPYSSPDIQADYRNLPLVTAERWISLPVAASDSVYALRRLLDAVPLYIASHGFFDTEGDYFLAAYGATPGAPGSGAILYEELERLLEGCAARQRLIVIDACHAGEVDAESLADLEAINTKEGKVTFRGFALEGPSSAALGEGPALELMKELFADLRRRAGVTVIAGAGGLDAAMEGPDWKNGAFTYCFLKGLREGAADLDEDGQVMVSELQRYLAKEVPRLTGGRQQPTFRVENISNDWRVW